MVLAAIRVRLRWRCCHSGSNGTAPTVRTAGRDAVGPSLASSVLAPGCRARCSCSVTHADGRSPDATRGGKRGLLPRLWSAQEESQTKAPNAVARRRRRAVGCVTGNGLGSLGTTPFIICGPRGKINAQMREMRTPSFRAASPRRTSLRSGMCSTAGQSRV